MLFRSEMEKDLDEISNGERDWLQFIEQFFRGDSQHRGLEDAAKQAEEQAKYDATVADVQTKAQTRLREAESWPDWADYKADVEKKLIEDTQKARGEGRRWGSMSLREAYLEVRANKVRESVLKEMQNAPKVPALSRGTTDAPKAPNGPVKTVDIVRQVIAKAEHGTGA